MDLEQVWAQDRDIRIRCLDMDANQYDCVTAYHRGRDDLARVVLHRLKDATIPEVQQFLKELNEKVDWLGTLVKLNKERLNGRTGE